MSTIVPIILKPISSARQMAVFRLAWPLGTLIRRNTAFSLRTSSVTRSPTSAIVRGWCVIHLKRISGWKKVFETASLFTLRAMSRSWRTAPPYPAWRHYASWLNAYAEQRLALREHQLPAGKSFLDWFQEHQPALCRNSLIWNWNTIIAIQLLSLFEADPRAWEAVTFLNQGSTGTNELLGEALLRGVPNAQGIYVPSLAGSRPYLRSSYRFWCILIVGLLVMMQPPIRK